jgi:hypothetical protein
MLALVSAALAFNVDGGALSRRAALSQAIGFGAVTLAPLAANAVSARTGLSSPFTGEYDDPMHPECLRSVKVVGAKQGPDGRRERRPSAYIKGVDNAEGTKACSGTPDLSSVWNLEGKVSEDGETIVIDFSPKGGPNRVVGTYDDLGSAPGIVFPDGNKWTKVAGGTPKRRPINPTLNSGS